MNKTIILLILCAVLGCLCSAVLADEHYSSGYGPRSVRQTGSGTAQWRRPMPYFYGRVEPSGFKSNYNRPTYGYESPGRRAPGVESYWRQDRRLPWWQR